MGIVKNGCGDLVHETLKYALSLNEFMSWADFLQAGCLARLTLHSVSLTFKCHSTVVVLVGPLSVVGRVLIKYGLSVLQSFYCPSACLAISWN